MLIDDALHQVQTIFLDSAPVVYYIERNSEFFARARLFFQQINDGRVMAVTSPITVAECLYYPYKQAHTSLIQAFQSLLIQGPNTHFIPINAQIADQSAQLRAHYNLGFADALQIATALQAHCDAFLTNDKKLKRVQNIKVIVLDQITT